VAKLVFLLQSQLCHGPVQFRDQEDWVITEAVLAALFRDDLPRAISVSQTDFAGGGRQGYRAMKVSFPRPRFFLKKL
jgi:hypothetical protein